MEAELRKMQLQAVAERVQRMMGAIESDQGQNLFSCVFVRWEDRRFAITASHCLMDIVDCNSLKIATYSGGGKSTRLATCDSAGFDPFEGEEHPSFDLAAIELDPKQARTLPVEFLDAEAAGSSAATPGTEVCIGGFPCARASVEDPAGDSVSRGAHVFFSEISARGLPELQRGNTEDPYLDLLIECKQQKATDWSGSSVRVEPVGMSGCGVFSVPQPVHGELWRPDAIQLVGIQASHYDMSGLLRAKRVEYAGILLREVGIDTDAT